MADEIKALEDELASYVGLRHRLGDEGYTFNDALLGHRLQCIQNLRDDGWDFWVERVKHLDSLAARRGIPMYDQPNLQREIDSLRERERQRRAERIVRPA